MHHASPPGPGGALTRFYGCAAARGNSLAIRNLSMLFIRGVMAMARRRGRRQTVRYMVAGC
jgi:hypothetical protein